jgi:formate/nitrite transporter FocA (FNT family)
MSILLSGEERVTHWIICCLCHLVGGDFAAYMYNLWARFQLKTEQFSSLSMTAADLTIYYMHFVCKLPNQVLHGFIIFHDFVWTCDKITK